MRSGYKLSSSLESAGPGVPAQGSSMQCCCRVVCCRVQPAHPAFHTARFIFPVGYTATCTYPSSVAAGGTTRYTTTIAEGAGGAALFVVVAADAPGKQWVATTAVGEHPPHYVVVADGEYVYMQHH
jgi:hypothetical protein